MELVYQVQEELQVVEEQVIVNLEQLQELLTQEVVVEVVIVVVVVKLEDQE